MSLTSRLPILLACCLATAGLAGAGATEPEAKGIVSCSDSPFGRSVPFIPDDEVVIVQDLTPGQFENTRGRVYDYSRAELLGNATRQQPHSIVGFSSGGSDARVASADLDGDPGDELVLAYVDSLDRINVEVHKRSSGGLTERSSWVGEDDVSSLVQVAIAEPAVDQFEIILLSRINGQDTRLTRVPVNAFGNVPSNGVLGRFTFVDAVDRPRIATGNFVGPTGFDGRRVGGDQVLLVSFFGDNDFGLHLFELEASSIASRTDDFALSRPFGGQTVRDELIYQTSRDFALVAANMAGDYAAEAVVGGISLNNLPGNDIGFAFARGLSWAGTQFDVTGEAAVSTINATRLALTTGDFDRDARAELVLGVQNLNGTNIYAYNVPTSGSFSQFEFELISLETSGGFSLEAGDADRDGRMDLFGAYPSGISRHEFNGVDFAGLVFDESFGNPQLTVMDADTDGVIGTRAEQASGCRTIEDRSILQVHHMPPYWDALQGSKSEFSVTLGKSTVEGTTRTVVSTSTSSVDVSAYVGASAGGEIAGVGVEASVRATAGETVEETIGVTQGRSTETVTTEVYEAGATGGADSRSEEGVIARNANSYDCFVYDVNIDGSPDAASLSRLCALASGNATGDNTRDWDRSFAGSSTGAAPPADWIPLHRDWANLALRSGAALDGRFNTSLDFPADDAAGRRIFRVDLGRQEAISNVRIWNGAQPGSGQRDDLNDLLLLISMDDPGTGTVSQLRGRADHEFQADTVGEVWNAWVRDPGSRETISGRYVTLIGASSQIPRVAEVQVFGDTQVDVHRYPVDIRTGRNGFHEADIYDKFNVFRTVEVRGDITWPEPSNGQVNLPRSSRLWNENFEGGEPAAWGMSESDTTFVGESNSYSESRRVGAEFDVEGGFVAKVQAGGGVEVSSGVTDANSQEFLVGDGFQQGARLPGIDPGEGSSLDVLPCRYNADPFSYLRQDFNVAGGRQTFAVTDYLIDLYDPADGLPAQCIGLPALTPADIPNQIAADFAGDSSGPLLPSDGGTIEFVNGRAVFGPDQGDGGRAYLRTDIDSFNTDSFEAFVTVTVFTGRGGSGMGYFGLGIGQRDPSFFNEPRVGPHLMVQVRPDDFLGGSFTVVDDGYEVSAGPMTAGSGRHRLCMRFDARTEQVTFAIHQNFQDGSPFIPSTVLGPFDLDDNAFGVGFPIGASLFLGGSGGAAFDDFEVNFGDIFVLPPPPPPLPFGLPFCSGFEVDDQGANCGFGGGGSPAGGGTTRAGKRAGTGPPATGQSAAVAAERR